MHWGGPHGSTQGSQPDSLGPQGCGPLPTTDISKAQGERLPQLHPLLPSWEMGTTGKIFSASDSLVLERFTATGRI